MPRNFQFSLITLFTVATLAAIFTWLATLGGTSVVAAFPVVVAVLWGIHRRDGIFLFALLLVILTWLIFVRPSP